MSHQSATSLAHTQLSVLSEADARAEAVGFIIWAPVVVTVA